MRMREQQAVCRTCGRAHGASGVCGGFRAVWLNSTTRVELPRVDGQDVAGLVTYGWVQKPGWPLVGASPAGVRVGTSLLDADQAVGLAALILAAVQEHQDRRAEADHV